MKNLDPDHILAILNLRMGDLFLTKQNNHGRPPVIGFFEYMEGVDLMRSLLTLSLYKKVLSAYTLEKIYFLLNLSIGLSFMKYGLMGKSV